MPLDGNVAIVTGGNSGIGLAIVRELARRRACVVIEAHASPLDDLQRLVDQAVAAFGRLDIMVNNAGVETRSLHNSVGL